MLSLKEELDRVLCKYTSLSLDENDECFSLKGEMTLNAEFNGIPLYDVYHVKLDVPKTFPKKIPLLTLLNNDEIPDGFEHLYPSNIACLGTFSDLFDFVSANDSLLAFIDEIIMSYLYSLSYYKRYGDFPYGERSHGNEGVWEAYFERYHVNNRAILVKLLLYTGGIVKYRGHHLCPCGSGKKLRNCHGKLILEDLKSDNKACYKLEALELLDDFISERRGKDGRTVSTKRYF